MDCSEEIRHLSEVCLRRLKSSTVLFFSTDRQFILFICIIIYSPDVIFPRRLSVDQINTAPAVNSGERSNFVFGKFIIGGKLHYGRSCDEIYCLGISFALFICTKAGVILWKYTLMPCRGSASSHVLLEIKTFHNGFSFV